ncbi:MAG TPA: hypothetical protein VF278_23815, partial [Pirellulales bacterium]
AARFGSDGEAMCLALAESRGWLVATDDKEAITVAQRARLKVVSSPELLKSWSLVTEATDVVKALMDIELFARFRPNSAMPECRWWLDLTDS